MDDESDISGSRNMNLTGASSVASVDDEQEEEQLRDEDAQDEADGAAAAVATNASRRKLPPAIATRYCFLTSLVTSISVHCIPVVEPK